MSMMRFGLGGGFVPLTTTTGVAKFGQQWRRVPLAPPFPDFGEDLFAILRHFLDESAGCPRLFVPRPPNKDLENYRRKINPFLRQPVVHSSRVCFFHLSGDDSHHPKLLQAVSENVRRNPFARFLELLKGPKPANH